MPESEVVTHQLAFHERDHWRICNEAGAVDDGVKGAELLVENLDLPLSVFRISKVTFLK
jgi:hypothetical protein